MRRMTPTIARLALAGIAALALTACASTPASTSASGANKSSAAINQYIPEPRD